MSAGKFTPGPWQAGWGGGLTGPTTPGGSPFCGGQRWEFTPVSRGEETIAVCPQQDTLAGDHEATATLIASCPDLLQMLHECAEYIAALNGEKDDYCQRARALIARATGEEK